MEKSQPLNMRYQRVFAALFLGFVGLFAVRFVLGFFVRFDFDAQEPARAGGAWLGEEMSYRRDVSSNLKSMSMTPQQIIQGGPIGQLEVFAKEARLGAATNAYDEDEKKAFETIRKNGSAVRIENREGLKPGRLLRLVVKAPDDRFEALVQDMKSVGRLEGVSVKKEDKTDEVRQLYAKKESLEAYKGSLVKLRSRAGKVEEFLALEEKLQGIEGEIQGLRVQLGDLVKEESYSNVSFSLRETLDLLGREKNPSLAGRILGAFAWTCLWYIAFLIVLGGAAAVVQSVRILRPSGK